MSAVEEVIFAIDDDREAEVVDVEEAVRGVREKIVPEAEDRRNGGFAGKEASYPLKEEDDREEVDIT